MAIRSSARGAPRRNANLSAHGRDRLDPPMLQPYATPRFEPAEGVERVKREQRLAELRKRREQSLVGGGAERIAKIHARGTLTARERLELLLDSGSFIEVGTFVTHRSADFGMD